MVLLKVMKKTFRPTGLKFRLTTRGIDISMGDYVRSMEDIISIQKANGDKSFTKLELNEFKKMTGKLSWLAKFTRPDLR